MRLFNLWTVRQLHATAMIQCSIQLVNSQSCLFFVNSNTKCAKYQTKPEIFTNIAKREKKHERRATIFNSGFCMALFIQPDFPKNHLLRVLDAYLHICFSTASSPAVIASCGDKHVFSQFS